jgi:hypothetical protein
MSFLGVAGDVKLVQLQEGLEEWVLFNIEHLDEQTQTQAVGLIDQLMEYGERNPAFLAAVCGTVVSATLEEAIAVRAESTAKELLE